MKGTIATVNEKAWNGKVLYSIKLTNDPTWYGIGEDKPLVKKGDLVEFDTYTTGTGRVNVSNGSIMVLKEGTAEPEIASAATGGWKGKPRFQKDEAKEAYWKNREERDVKVQERIQYQSARNSAIALVDVLLKNNAVKLPEAAGKRYDVVLSLVEHITEAFNKPKDIPEAAPDEAVDAVVAENEEMGNW